MDVKLRFTKSINSLFRHSGIDGFYQRIGKEKIPVRLIIRQPDPLFELGDRHIVVDQLRIDVRVSEIPLLYRGDSFIINDKYYSIEEEPTLDQHQLVWLLDVLPVRSSIDNRSRLRMR